MVLAAGTACGAETHFLLLSQEEAARIKAAVARGDRRVAAAAQSLRRAAGKALEEGPWSVTFHRPAGVPAGKHDFYSEGPYWWPDPKNPKGPYIRRDGETNPDRFMAHRNDSERMGDAVLTLGAAAWLFDEPRYAARARELLFVWFLDPETRMNPNLEFGQAVRGRDYGRNAGIIDGRPFVWTALGVTFLERTPGWDAAAGAGLRKWFAAYTEWLTGSAKGLAEKKTGNNHSTWWAVQVAAYAGFTGDRKMQEMVWNHYREVMVPGQFRPDGGAPREEARTRSLSYSAMNLDAFTLLCRMAGIAGTDLWRYRAPNGAALERAVAYLAPYVAQPEKWRLPQIRAYEAGGNYFPALAAIGFGRSEYTARQAGPGGSGRPWHLLVEMLLKTSR